MYSFVHSTVFIHYRPHSATLLQVLGPRMQCLPAKRLTRCPPHPFLPLLGTVRLHLPACLAALWPCDWALTSRTQARVTLRIPNRGPLKTFHMKASLSLPPLSVNQRQSILQVSLSRKGRRHKMGVWKTWPLPLTWKCHLNRKKKKKVLLSCAKSLRCSHYLLQQLGYPDPLPWWNWQGKKFRSGHNQRRIWLQINHDLWVLYGSNQRATVKNYRDGGAALKCLNWAKNEPMGMTRRIACAHTAL